MLLSFSAAALKNNVKLNWITGNEMNNSGFDVERKETTKEKTWQKIGFVRGYGTTAEQKHYEFEDKKMTTGSYYYRLKQLDFNGNFEYFELSSEVLVKSPLEFRVSQNYPNPSNPNSKIDFEIPFEGWVNLRIYNLLGQQVKELVNGNRNADYYTVEFDGSNFASGIYFYITSVEGSGKKFTNTMKMVILK
jgi:Secretion system C-terminal sorting domain